MKKHRVLNLGAGVQSSTVYLMMCDGLAEFKHERQFNLFNVECEELCGV